MILFLTGNTFRYRAGCGDKDEMIPDNHLIDEMRKVFPDPCRALYFCDDYDDEENGAWFDKLTDEFIDGFEYSGFQFESFICVDGRNASQAEELIRQANFIILGGGHTPSQNRFFKSMGLADLLKSYDGVIWAISAGSMNCAETVYAAPEEDGEALDPDYERFLTGLGLTKTTILPHYNYWKDRTLDGLDYINEIVLPDSMGKTFYYITDGSYILVKDGIEELRGEAYIVHDGTINPFTVNGDSILL